MNALFTLLNAGPYINSPRGVAGWIIWLALALLCGLSLYKWKDYNKGWGKRQIFIFVLLLLITPFTSLFFGVRFNPLIELPPPGVPVDPSGQSALIFSAVPWIFAGGLLGPLPAAILGLCSGLLRALWDTHNPFLALETALLAVLFSAAIMQRYRTPVFRFIRQPIAAATLLALLYPLLYLATTPFTIQETLVVQLDYALSYLPSTWLAVTIELVLAGLLAQLASLLLPALWGDNSPLKPSPAERSLQARFFYGMVPLGLLLVLTLIAGSWLIAGAVSRDMLKSQMETTTLTVADQIPFFFENGQILLSQAADDGRLYTSQPGQLYEVLEGKLKLVPFFSQFVVLDETGRLVQAYPDSQGTGQQMSIDEQIGVQLALAGMPYQTFSAQPRDESGSAQISFITPVLDEANTIRRILLARADLETNPFTQPLISSLQSMQELNADGILIDENNQILVHPDRSMIMTSYAGKTDNPEPFYEEAAADGDRHLVYFQPVRGIPWTTVMTVPLLAAQQLSLRIVAPLLGMIFILALLAVLVLNLSIQMVIGSLESLASEADDIAKGNLDQPLPVEGVDEVGKLRQAFEKMRISLKSRMDELNLLLRVNQGVASTLEMEASVQPLLESALSMGASAVRIVLTQAVMPELGRSSVDLTCYSAGPSQNLYSELNAQIVDLNRSKDQIILSSLTHPRMLALSPGQPQPASLIALALRHENLYFGSMWVAYNEAHQFSDHEIRFLATLASQATVAAANARLFLTAEIGRQRLAAILASSPDPVLVTDQSNVLILANPAAWHLFGGELEVGIGRPIDQVIQQKTLLDLLIGRPVEKPSAEVVIQDGKVYLAAVSSVEAEGHRVGRVCLLRDVTKFKELDALKSEFVSTVSHDLRNPLALMRGNASMLEMVGQLNTQQSNYVRKILGGVDSMSHLVNNLLDLGRIEAGVGLKLEFISPTEIIERTVHDLQVQATQKKIQIKTDFPPQATGLRVEADAALLQQALYNLVENAIKFTHSEGKVTVRLQHQPDRVIFEVNDTGNGISPMDQPRLFEKFYRGPQTTSQENQGSGLGLAIVHSIAERHNGKVWVESQLGKGSTFYLTIPLQQGSSPLR